MARAATEDDSQVEVRDGSPERPEELKPRDRRRISLRFRRRKENVEPRGPAVIGTQPCPSTSTSAHSVPTLEPPPQPHSNHALCVQRTQPQLTHCW